MNEQASHTKAQGLGALVRGEASLKAAFWLWGAAGGAGQVLALAVLVLAVNDAPEGLAGWLFLGWIGFIYLYFAVVFIGIWRSAGVVMTNAADKPFAIAARVMVALGTVLAGVMTLQVVFMGGSPH